MQINLRRAALVLLGSVCAQIALAQTYTHVETFPVINTLHQKIYKREVVGLAYPVGIQETCFKRDECYGSAEPCPWGGSWASLFNNNESNHYLGYSGGGEVPAGRIYKWYYEYDYFMGWQKWKQTINNEVIYYQRTREYYGNMTSLQLEDVDAGAPPGEGS